MNHHSRIFWVVNFCFFSLIMAGCNLPISRADSSPTAAAVYTSAAETISAQLTSIAPTSPSQITPSPTGETDQLGQAETQTALPSETVLPTATPTPEDTSTPSVTPSPTLAAFDPIANLGEPNWRDTFENTNNWAPYEDEYVRFNIREGQMVMVSKEAESRDSWMLSWPDPENFYIEMSAVAEDCSGLDRYGLIFRSDAETGYLFGISCDGRYSLREWDGETFTSLIDWRESAHILTREEEANRQGVLVEGDMIKVYVNGVQLDEFEDKSYREGSFGVFIGSPNTENFRVIVDQFAYWELP